MPVVLKTNKRAHACTYKCGYEEAYAKFKTLYQYMHSNNNNNSNNNNSMICSKKNPIRSTTPENMIHKKKNLFSDRSSIFCWWPFFIHVSFQIMNWSAKIKLIFLIYFFFDNLLPPSLVKKFWLRHWRYTRNEFFPFGFFELLNENLN